VADAQTLKWQPSKMHMMSQYRSGVPTCQESGLETPRRLRSGGIGRWPFEGQLMCSWSHSRRLELAELARILRMPPTGTETSQRRRAFHGEGRVTPPCRANNVRSPGQVDGRWCEGATTG